MLRSFFLVTLIAAGATSLPAQQPRLASSGAVRGSVTLKSNGDSLHKVTVTIVQLGRSVQTAEDGAYEFANVPPGAYMLVAHMAALSDERQTVTVTAGAVATADFQLRLAVIKEQITVTASGREETALESFQATASLDSIDLTLKAQPSIGEVLENQAGVAKRSFGPGTSRPVLRGFDGDRILVLLDGLSTGSIASQSGDHGENLDVLNLERVEIVRGPATLLYGSSAIGGVVNAITRHHQIHEHPHPGLSGYASGALGSTNGMGGGGAGFEYGIKNWLLWAGASGQRAGNYHAPFIGEIANSRARNSGGRAGFGRYAAKAFSPSGSDYDNRRYGIPFAAFLASGGSSTPADEQTNLRLQRHDLKLTTGFRHADAPIANVRLALGYTQYRHGEYDADSLETDFHNRVFNYRLTFEQKKFGLLTGSFGLSGWRRDYKSIGAEALAPPTVSNNFSVFTLQTVDFGHLALQFGGRLERTSYDPGLLPPSPPPPARSFTGISGAAGVRVDAWKGGVFVVNYTHSFRAPALEELYNNGPHPGNLAFEIGNARLSREQGNGLDISLRHSARRLRAEANFFYYRLGNYVFLTPTGNISPQGLFEAEYLQGGTRYTGGELTCELGVADWLWFNGGLDAVRAELTQAITSPLTLVTTPAGTPLPRIPPLRGRFGLDFRYKGFSFRPEAIIAAPQNQIFTTETRPPGYTVFHFNASYTIAEQHFVHVFAVNAFNLGDRLYRNHLSFIKNLSPEIGRGLRFSYTVRFF